MKKLFQHDIFSYLFFGVMTTLVYLSVRLLIFDWLHLPSLVAAVIANLAAILFAFATNDTLVFKQQRLGWQTRFVKFFTARLGTLALDLLLVYLFVEKFPQLIGQFVNHDLSLVDKIESLGSQVLIIVGNYFLSKFLIFTDH